MPAFDALEKRVVDLTLAGVQDSPERVVVVGLFTSLPADAHSGAYGISGEPAAGGTYKRSRIRFAPQATRNDGSNARTVNVDAVTITGLAPGTYTHFAIFGSSTAGA